MVQIEVQGFTGPIDLLLDLIDREELDITALSLAEVTDQYWREVETNSAADPDALAEFINVGSKLLFIKSCALLPSAKPPEADLEQEIDQTAEELRRCWPTTRFRTRWTCSASWRSGRRTFGQRRPHPCRRARA
jgi:segregation and condensation protein A